MKLLRALPLLALACLPLATRGDDKKPAAPKTLGTIERLDPAFDKLIGKDAKLEVLADGFDWVEGPVWVPKGGFLLFSDIPNNSVFKWQQGKGTSLFLKPSGYEGKRTDFMEPGSNGLLVDAKGRLVLMEHGDRRVSRINIGKKGRPAGKKTILADKYMGKRLNSPNDGAFKSNGDLYFTDPPYGRMLKGKPWVFPDRDLDFCGIYRLSAGGGLKLLTKEMTYPNGIAFSPDEKTLYVANSDPKLAIWKSFPVKDDGTLGEGKVFFDATKWVPKKKGLPDGLKVDVNGILFATGPGGVLVFAPDGKHLGTIATGVPTSNCGWGPDGYLYVTADKALCRIKTRTKGKGF
jgi:gluconolactonase